MSKGDAQKKLDLANGETFQQKEGGHVEGPSFYQKMKTGDYMIHVIRFFKSQSYRISD